MGRPESARLRSCSCFFRSSSQLIEEELTPDPLELSFIFVQINQAVAYLGFLLLVAVAVVVFVVLKATASWFSPTAFWGGLFALVPVAAYVTYLARRGRIAELIVDADRAAAAHPKERA